MGSKGRERFEDASDAQHTFMIHHRDYDDGASDSFDDTAHSSCIGWEHADYKIYENVKCMYAWMCLFFFFSLSLFCAGFVYRGRGIILLLPLPPFAVFIETQILLEKTRITHKRAGFDLDDGGRIVDCLPMLLLQYKY